MNHMESLCVYVCVSFLNIAVTEILLTFRYVKMYRHPKSFRNMTRDWHGGTFPSPSYWTMPCLVYIHVFCFPCREAFYCSCLARIGNACITYKIEVLSL